MRNTDTSIMQTRYSYSFGIYCK